DSRPGLQNPKRRFPKARIRNPRSFSYAAGLIFIAAAITLAAPSGHTMFLVAQRAQTIREAIRARRSHPFSTTALRREWSSASILALAWERTRTIGIDPRRMLVRSSTFSSQLNFEIRTRYGRGALASGPIVRSGIGTFVSRTGRSISPGRAGAS